MAENEFYTTKFPDFFSKFSDLQRSILNSLTFPGFPGQLTDTAYFENSSEWNLQTMAEAPFGN